MAAEHHSRNLTRGILERKIAVARGLPLEVADLSLNEKVGKAGFELIFDHPNNLADRESLACGVESEGRFLYTFGWMTRRHIVAGNWKMYKTASEAVEFVETLAGQLPEGQAEVWLAVPFTAIRETAAVAGPIVVGAQNMNDATEGAFTGEIAGRMLIDAGARFVLIGHSERRHVFGESDAFINRKVKRAIADGLQPLLCVGETLDERKEGQTHEVLTEQLTAALEGVESLESVVLAYEPVWAIGTGHSATPEIAQEAHSFCRAFLSERGVDLPILYGGSVKPDNAATLMAQEDIDGVLVGGASLDPEQFLKIIGGIS
jgi:triosephosphate isomerase (TIM)